MLWNVKTADMKFLAMMAKNEAMPSTQERKRNDKQSVLWDKVFAVFFGFNNTIIIDLHVTGLATHLNIFDWLFNNAFQRKFYV